MGASGARNGGESGSDAGFTNTQKSKVTKKKSNFMPISLQIIKGIGEKLEDAARPYNTTRRKKFISKYNTSVPPEERIDMTDEKIGSKEGLAKLRDIGYKTNQDTVRENLSRGNGDNQVTQVPKILLSPTTVEVSQSEAANATSKEDPLYVRKKKTKAKGRSETILTSSKGVTIDDELTLGKKSLLGA